MARSYGRIWTAIWNEDDWLALSVDGQWLYKMLLTQSTISPCGVLPVTIGRWAKYAKGLTRKRVSAAIDELSASGHVIHDGGTEEILVRTFVKHDGAGANQLRITAIVEGTKAVHSKTLLAAIVEQLDAAGISHSLSIGVRDPIEGLSKGSRKTPVVVKQVGKYPQPQPEPQSSSAILKGEPEPFAADAAPPGEFCKKHPQGIEDACRPCGDARRAHKAWITHESQASIAELGRIAAARIACDFCDDDGHRALPDGRLTRCTHHPETEATA